MSTPQPRLGEDFTVTVEVDTIAKSVFGSLTANFTVSSYVDPGNETSKLGVNLQAKKLGKNEVGPFVLNINGKKYLTDKLVFDVVDSLPRVNQGLWIRQVHVDDTTSYIIVEQRIPAMSYISHPDSSTISLTTKVSEDQKKTEMVEDSVVSFHGSSEGPKSFTDPITKENINYQNYYARYSVKHEKNKPLVLTKQYFTNLPEYYKFVEIVVK
jgi:hypothetical protein